MTDKFNKNNGSDDINKFFEQFDAVENNSSEDQKHESATRASRSAGSTRASRSKK